MQAALQVQLPEQKILKPTIQRANRKMGNMHEAPDNWKNANFEQLGKKSQTRVVKGGKVRPYWWRRRPRQVSRDKRLKT